MLITDINVDISQLIALQRAAEHVALINKKSVQTARSGSYLSHIRGRGMDFDETRGYQAGDDIRFMDWRVMARSGRAHTKLFREERERPVFIVLDQSLSMRFGSRVTFKSVVAAQAAAILAWAAVHQGDRVGGVVFHDSDFHAIKPRSRKQGVLPLMQQIARLNNETPEFFSSQQLELVVAQLRRICYPGGLVFMISDFTGMTPIVERHMRNIAEHSEIIACHVSDPLERDAPLPGTYQVTNGNQLLRFDTHSKAFCDKYNQQFTLHFDEVKTILGRQRIPLISLSTQDDVATVLYHALLKVRGVKK
jgi:uncharacterized protein (DUF58 family)